MPFPLAAVAGAAIPGVLNAASDLYANYQNRQYNTQMYNRQRGDSIEFWNMQNAYNTPEEQMKRYSSAGLNPNLIYGSSGDNSAGNIPTPDVQPANIRAPHFDRIEPMQILLAQADLKIKNAQANNLQTQNDVMVQDAVLRKIQAERAGFDLQFSQETKPYDFSSRVTSAQRGLFDLNFARDTRDSNFDLLNEHVRQLRTGTDLSINRDVRESLMNSSNINEALERIATMRSQRATSSLERAKIQQELRILKSDNTIKEWEAELSKRNQTPHDGMWWRMIGDYIDRNFSEGKYDRQPLRDGSYLPKSYTPSSHPSNH